MSSPLRPLLIQDPVPTLLASNRVPLLQLNLGSTFSTNVLCEQDATVCCAGAGWEVDVGGGASGGVGVEVEGAGDGGEGGGGGGM